LRGKNNRGEEIHNPRKELGGKKKLHLGEGGANKIYLARKKKKEKT